MSSVARRNDLRSAPTTPGQRKDWKIHNSRPDGSFLNLAEAYSMDGPLDKTALGIAVDGLVARHEALRTRFRAGDGYLVQLIEDEESALRPGLITASEADGTPEADWLSSMVSQPFDLTAGPPVRIGLLERKRGDHLLAVVMHHIISDRFSFDIALADLAEFLAARAGSREPRLPLLPVQFPDYAAWYQASEDAGELDRSFRYWRDMLTGAPEITAVPANPAASPEAASEERQIPVSASRLRSRSRRLRTTPYVVLLAMFAQALAELTGAADQTIGCGYANRPTDALQHSVGRFISLLPLRMDVPPTAPPADAVGAAHRVAMGAYVNAAVPLDAVIERGLLGEPTAPIPYTNVAFQLFDESPVKLSVPGVTVKPVAVGGSTTRRDLNVVVMRADDRLTVYLDYRPSSIAPSWIRSLADGFTGRLRELAGQAGYPDEASVAGTGPAGPGVLQ